MKPNIFLYGAFGWAFFQIILMRGETIQEFSTRFKLTNPALLYLREFIAVSSISKESVKEEAEKIVVDEASRRMASNYDRTFQQLRKCGGLQGPCDWGDDMSEGPHLLLPHLPIARDLARVGIVRARVALESGDSMAAAQDLVAVSRMSSHLAASPILINLLVDYSIDRTVADFLSRNLHRFDMEALRELKNGFEALPAEKTIADAVDTERSFMAGWFQSELDAASKSSGTEEARLAAIRNKIFDSIALSSESFDETWSAFLKASGGTVKGLVLLATNALPPFLELKALCHERDYSIVKPKFDELERRIQVSDNPFLKLLYPAISRARYKEMGNVTLNAMVRAAIDIQLNGRKALSSSSDPFGNGAFGIETVKEGDAAIGYMLVSSLPIHEENRRVFLSREANSIQICGADAGMASKETP